MRERSDSWKMPVRRIASPAPGASDRAPPGRLAQSGTRPDARWLPLPPVFHAAHRAPLVLPWGTAGQPASICWLRQIRAGGLGATCSAVPMQFTVDATRLRLVLVQTAV